MRKFRRLNHLRARTGLRGRVSAFHGNWVRAAHLRKSKHFSGYRRARRGRR